MQNITTVPVHVSSPTQRSWLQVVLQTDASWTPVIARVALGAVMLPHGLQKLFGWFGGFGFTNTMAWFTDSMGVPWIFGFAAILAETLGALALLVGGLTRVAAAGVGAVFLTAVAMVHARFGFFMNWGGSQGGEGIEYFILGLALVAIVIVKGGGAASLDRTISRSRISRPGN